LLTKPCISTMRYVKVPSHVERNSRGLADVTSQVPRNKNKAQNQSKNKRN